MKFTHTSEQKSKATFKYACDSSEAESEQITLTEGAIHFSGFRMPKDNGMSDLDESKRDLIRNVKM